MNHKEKVQLANRLIRPLEIKFGRSIWDSYGWNLRRRQIANRVFRKQSAAHSRALERKQHELDKARVAIA